MIFCWITFNLDAFFFLFLEKIPLSANEIFYKMMMYYIETTVCFLVCWEPVINLSFLFSPAKKSVEGKLLRFKWKMFPPCLSSSHLHFMSPCGDDRCDRHVSSASLSFSSFNRYRPKAVVLIKYTISAYITTVI